MSEIMPRATCRNMSLIFSIVMIGLLCNVYNGKHKLFANKHFKVKELSIISWGIESTNNIYNP